MEKNNEQAAEDLASQHEWSRRMALQIKSLPAPLKTHRSPFFRCWHGWTWRGLIKGHFPGESVSLTVIFAQFDMQPGCCFPFLSVPQAYLLALLQSTRCSQSSGGVWAGLKDTWNGKGASCMTLGINQNLAFWTWSWFDQDNIYYISTAAVHHQFNISWCPVHICHCHSPT